MRPTNVGILAIEVYFPKIYVSQEELEVFDGVSKGKYTVGLGQKNMSFVEPYEDVNSMALTVVQNTLEKYKIDPRQIGRLEVGTETLLDKSKSTKTVLMQLFSSFGNNDIEGVSSINACYGGTAALFNTVAWVESSAYDGKKLGCVVTVDVAVYKKGSARPTGGAGAVCMIIGPDSQIVIEPIRSSFLDHAYDFYKPDPRSEFPTVDGHLSIKTYLSAIDNNYQTMDSKYQALKNSHFTLKNIDYGCFHAPFQKMVQKAYTRLLFNDVVNGNNKDFLNTINPETIQFLKSANYSSKEVQSLIGKITFPSFLEKVKPSLFMGENLGNIYTGSLYSGLCSLICNDSINLKNKRVLMFSYGSGLASSLFTLKFGHDYSKIARLLNLSARMAARIKISPTEYDQIMALREKAFGFVPSSPIVNFDRIEPGTYYLSSVDSMWRRQYQRYTRDSIKARSAWICKNDCSSQNQENKAFVLDDALFLEQKTKLTERLEQFKRQMSSVQSNNSSAASMNTENSKSLQQQQSIVTKKRSHSSDKNLNAKIWAGFYKKTLLERLDQIQKVESGIDTQIFLDGGLTLERAELMIENCIGKISLPLGLGLNFKINNKYYTVPMATEEPSVIAAASSAAKFIDENGGGFQTFSTRPIMIGQIQLLNVDPTSVVYKIDQNKDKLLAYANEICQNMVARGGGAKDIRVRILDAKEKKVRSTGEFEVDQMAVVDFLIHVCDSMGANIVNTIMEYVAPMVEEITGGRAGLKILSNLCTERRAVAEFEIPVSKMGWKDASGETVVKRMLEGYRFAQLDPFRASTHNKGILNGMDAVAIATGQDWRSIESSCHTYASVKDRKAGYQPLTHYQLIRSKKQSSLGELVFHGSIEVPIAVGSQGGVLHSNQLYQNNLKLLGFPNAQQLSEIIAAVGLGQNFSALKALAIEGIQKGHMNLHARNIAISGGVPTHLVEEATRFMRSRSKMNVDTAKAYLQAHNLFELVRLEEKDTAATVKQPLSTFYVELECETLDEPIILHVALDCLVGPDHQPIHLTIEPQQQQSSVAQKQPSFVQDIQTLLFGPKGYEWLLQIFQALELVNLNFSEKNILNASVSSETLGGTATPPPRKLLYKLKLIAIIIDLLANNMLALDCERSTKVIEQLMTSFSQQRKSMLAKLNIPGLIGNSNKSEPLSLKDMALQFGLTLLSECIRVFEYNIDSTRVASQLLKETLLSELALILESQVQARLLWRRAIKGQPLPQEDQSTFLQYRQKRLCATMMLFCDCVNLNSSLITPAALEVIRKLGSLYEIEITIARDFHKWQPNLKEVNLYSFWLLQRNELKNGELPTNKTAFMAEYLNVLAQKRKNLEPMLDEKLRALCDISSEVIRSFYNFQDKISPKSRL